ncbi:hypothetical protein [Leuconostoc suionicum]|uniref:hypothetical protein n=1 Tax=Leuconostoc suionicum TaxID=1511761 RepID=UPI00233EAE0C|nr:hypothetical protein [Leuconostoc suionicum]MDC2805040.1 hypothetical protein [Leuconostoc suionicum]MDC2822552.1 hypothetical protein [Leuconostoc suionicum]
MRKRVFTISFIGILIVVAGIIGIIVSDNLHKIPYYNSSTNHIILSDKINKLSGDQQKKEMFTLARNALKKETDKNQNFDWSNFEDDSLYVEKLKSPHVYLLGYTIQSRKPLVLNIRYNLVVKIGVNNSRAKSDEIQVLNMELSIIK